jgi:uncharacterized membrane protein YeaQ/YmgE (transglycosylase-associated protein family)
VDSILIGTALAAERAGDAERFDIGSLLGYVIVGIVVGFLARLLVPGRDPMGFVMTLVIGIVGSVIGGWLAGAAFEDTQGVDWIASLLVAIGLVLVMRRFWGQRARA